MTRADTFSEFRRHVAAADSIIARAAAVHGDYRLAHGASRNAVERHYIAAAGILRRASQDESNPMPEKLDRSPATAAAWRRVESAAASHLPAYDA